MHKSIAIVSFSIMKNLNGFKHLRNRVTRLVCRRTAKYKKGYLHIKNIPEYSNILTALFS